MNRSKIMGASALFLGIILAVSTVAFKPVKSSKRVNAYWRFDGNALSQSKTSSEYTLIDAMDIPSCDQLDEIPCVLEVDQSVDTQSELQTILNGYGSNQAVVDDAFATKAE
ncbi:hypothetical protein [Pedobacter cryophilus]|uniref:Uncharacterized protein n=1 Tax=Pedobacter cryophilus TaxID=2571271 RepID=A0A4U1C0C0_9SPHI|nr:hypothetical protein [Pedobacter cryophilus]TKB98641.1 hypothetical protein FA046_05855 [Pedobacter cryophilus]